MRYASCCLLFVAVVACSADKQTESADELGRVTQPIVGGQLVEDVRTGIVGAVGLVDREDGHGTCTGTLVDAMDLPFTLEPRPFFVLTAAHCVCGLGPRLRFRLPWYSPTDPDHGDDPYLYNYGYGIIHPNFTCNTEKLKPDSSNDIAVIRLEGPFADGPVPVAPIWLGSRPEDSDGGGTVAGVGAFHDEATAFLCDQLNIYPVGEETRRIWDSFPIWIEEDPCDALVEDQCYDGRYWATNFGIPTRPGPGDSGAPLITTIRGTEVVAGVAVGARCPDPLEAGGIPRHIWAMTRGESRYPWAEPLEGKTAGFLANALDVPFSLGERSQNETAAALWGKDSVRVNDRATVHGDVVASEYTSNMRIGVDARILDGFVYAGGTAILENGSYVDGSVFASNLANWGSVRGVTHADTVVRLRDLTARRVRTVGNWPADFTYGGYFPELVVNSGDFKILGGSEFPQGEYGRVVVNPGGRLMISPGLYIIENFQAESNAVIEWNTWDPSSAEPSPIYLAINNRPIWRAQMVYDAGDAAEILIGLAATVYGRAGSLHFESTVNGTIVAPESVVRIDAPPPVDHHRGAVIAKEIELFEGDEFTHVPFRHGTGDHSGWAPILY